MAKEKNEEKTNNLPKRAPKDGEVGVTYLAEALGIAPASVRVKLRKANIEPNESGVYSWTKARADTIAKQLKTPAKEKEAA